MDLDGFFRALRVLTKEGRKRWRPFLDHQVIRFYGPRHRYPRSYRDRRPRLVRYYCCPITALYLAGEIEAKKKHKTVYSNSSLFAITLCREWLGLEPTLFHDIVVAADGNSLDASQSRPKMIRQRMLRSWNLKEKKVA
jgi:hypothetical protein